ncbi:MAG: hypothetical protein ACPLSY_03500 [Moorellaceae bacterium]
MVERAREGGRNAYRLSVAGRGEEVFEGFGNAVPEEVERAAGACRIEANGVALTPSLANQMDPPFVIGESAATAAAVIGLVSRAEVFDAALRDANADAARLRREVRSLEEEVAEFDRQLEEFADLPSWEEAIATASSALDATRQASARRERVAALAAARTEAVAEVEAAERVLGVLASIGAVVEISEKIQGLVVRLQVLTGLAVARRETERTLADATAVVERTSGVREAARLEGCIAEALSRLRRLADLGRGWSDAVHEIADAGVRLHATSGVDAAGRAVAVAGEALSRLSVLRSLAFASGEASRDFHTAVQEVEATGRLSEAEELLDSTLKTLRQLDSLYALIKGVATVTWEASEAQSELEGIASQVNRATGDLVAALTELGRCPVCYKAIERSEIDDIVKNLVDH